MSKLNFIIFSLLVTILNAITVDDCTENQYFDATSSTCKQCDNSRQSLAKQSGTASCICKIDFYSNLTDNTACTPCDKTRTAPTPGSTDVAQCVCKQSRSSTQNNNTPCLCSVNFYGDENNCQACDKSRSSVAGSKLETDCVCAINYFGTTLDNSVCGACHGSRQSDLGAKTADDCKCKQHTFGPNDNKQCTLCDSSRSTLAAGNTEITACICDAGRYGPLDNSRCGFCEEGWSSAQNSMNPTDCYQVETFGQYLKFIHLLILLVMLF